MGLLGSCVVVLLMLIVGIHGEGLLRGLVLELGRMPDLVVMGKAVCFPGVDITIGI